MQKKKKELNATVLLRKMWNLDEFFLKGKLKLADPFPASWSASDSTPPNPAPEAPRVEHSFSAALRDTDVEKFEKLHFTKSPLSLMAIDH